MPLENRFHDNRSSRLLRLRRGDAAMFGAGKMLAERPEGAWPHSHRQGHHPVIQGPPEVNDRMLRAPSDRSWRAISAVSAVRAKTAHVLDTCGELLICRVLLAVVSWIFERALEGCVAYATAMYGIPAEEFRDRRDHAGEGPNKHQNPDEFVSPIAGGISTKAKGGSRRVAASNGGDIEYPVGRGVRLK